MTWTHFCMGWDLEIHRDKIEVSDICKGYFSHSFVLIRKIYKCEVDSERLSSRMSFQLEDKVLDTSKP